jgi:hypothetical protein
MAFQAISNPNLTMRRASASHLPNAHWANGPSAPRRTTRGICLAIANREPQFPAPLTPVALQENSWASQLNNLRRANQSIPSRKTRCRERETWQIKSPNSVIKTRSNSLKTNDGDMHKSPKNPKTRLSLPSTFPRRDSCFSALPSPRATAILPSNLSQICKWSRPLLTGSLPQTEIGLTYRKQTTEKSLSGARTHISETRICAKISSGMSEETNEEKSAEMSNIKAMR